MYHRLGGGTVAFVRLPSLLMSRAPGRSGTALPISGGKRASSGDQRDREGCKEDGGTERLLELSVPNRLDELGD